MNSAVYAPEQPLKILAVNSKYYYIYSTGIKAFIHGHTKPHSWLDIAGITAAFPWHDGLGYVLDDLVYFLPGDAPIGDMTDYVLPRESVAGFRLGNSDTTQPSVTTSYMQAGSMDAALLVTLRHSTAAQIRCQMPRPRPSDVQSSVLLLIRDAPANYELNGLTAMRVQTEKLYQSEPVFSGVFLNREGFFPFFIPIDGLMAYNAPTNTAYITKSSTRPANRYLGEYSPGNIESVIFTCGCLTLWLEKDSSYSLHYLRSGVDEPGAIDLNGISLAGKVFAPFTVNNLPGFYSYDTDTNSVDCFTLDSSYTTLELQFSFAYPGTDAEQLIYLAGQDCLVYLTSEYAYTCTPSAAPSSWVQVTLPESGGTRIITQSYPLNEFAFIISDTLHRAKISEGGLTFSSMVVTTSPAQFLDLDYVEDSDVVLAVSANSTDVYVYAIYPNSVTQTIVANLPLGGFDSTHAVIFNSQLFCNRFSQELVDTVIMYTNELVAVRIYHTDIAISTELTIVSSLATTTQEPAIPFYILPGEDNYSICYIDPLGSYTRYFSRSVTDFGSITALASTDDFFLGGTSRGLLLFTVHNTTFKYYVNYKRDSFELGTIPEAAAFGHCVRLYIGAVKSIQSNSLDFLVELESGNIILLSREELYGRFYS